MIIRSDERIKRNGEVFTPPCLVNDMLDKLPTTCWEEGKTFLDPAAGTGNMLVWVLIRKIQNGDTPINALRCVYGVELMPDNVNECRIRLLREYAIYAPVDEEAITAVLTNIVCADALTYEYEFNKAPDSLMVRWWLFEARRQLKIMEAEKRDYTRVDLRRRASKKKVAK